MRAQERVFSWEEHTNQVSNTKWSSLKTYVQVTDRLNGLYLEINMYVHTHTYMHVTTINRTIVYDFKESKEEYVGGFGGRKGERYNCNVAL